MKLIDPATGQAVWDSNDPNAGPVPPAPEGRQWVRVDEPGDTMAPRRTAPGILDIGNGVTERLAFLNQTFNPVEGIGSAMRAGSRMVAPDQSYWDRIASLGDMVSGVASIAAPIAAAKAIGVPAASAMMEGLLGFSPARQAAGDMATQFARSESGALPGGGPGPAEESKGFTVWHGTPHTFPPAVRVLDSETGQTYVQAADDPVALGMLRQQPERYSIIEENPLGMFDFSKMGTGEGAQAYGWGGYQAERRGIGQSYRDALTGNQYGDRRVYKIDGQEISDPTVIQRQVANGMSIDDIVKNRKKRLAIIEGRLANAPSLSSGDDITESDISVLSDRMERDKMLAEIQDAESLRGRNIEISAPGALYESNIKANPEDFLEWERPISEQGAKVKEAFGLGGRVAKLLNERAEIIKEFERGAEDAPVDDFDAFFKLSPEQEATLAKLEKIDSEIKSTPFGLLAKNFSQSEADRIGRLTGKDAYSMLTDAAGALDWPASADFNTRRMYQSLGQKGASEILRKSGLPGSKHIDAATRGQPYVVDLAYKGKPFDEGYFEPQFAQSREEAESIAREYQEKGYDANVRDVATRNYVVFDENLINIVRKYGIAGAATMLGVSALDVEQALAENMSPSQWDQLVVGPQ